MTAVLAGSINAGDVLVIRYEGPKGGPGNARNALPHLGDHRCGPRRFGRLITDGRFSGGTYGLVVGHVAPEAAVGGTIGLVEEGDSITIDAETLTLSLNVTNRDIRHDAPPGYRGRRAIPVASWRNTRSWSLRPLSALSQI
jgi:dihydroxy-acid dehydratase